MSHQRRKRAGDEESGAKRVRPGGKASLLLLDRHWPWPVPNRSSQPMVLIIGRHVTPPEDGSGSSPMSTTEATSGMEMA